MMARGIPTLMALVAVSLGLAACGNDNYQDIRQWMRDSTRNLKGHIPPLPQVQQSPAVAYEAGNLVDPFQPSKIRPEKKGGGGGLQPDLNRRKEPLESFPLETLKMVGTMSKGKTLYALVQADRTYLVRPGNYMGQNFGVITGITETQITLKELVEDTGGDWTDRTSTLQLQETQESKK